MTNELNIKNISMTVQLLKENNIRRIVISPGGTNIPFVKMVQDDNFFKCYSVVDERSAIYFAIGLHLQTGEIIATSCTSAQATRNYIPGLTEAFYKRVPILAITMQKHPRFTYQEYMQAPDQTSLPEDCVKKSFQLPFITDNNDMLHSIRLINEAILSLTYNGYGPVQLCIPWIDFPTFEQEPRVRNINRYYSGNTLVVNQLKDKKILLVIGEHRPFSLDEKNNIESFCSAYNVCVYSNHLSNYSGKFTVNGNLVCSTLNVHQASKIKPDIILSIGGQTGDYPLYKMLTKFSANEVEHWRVAEDGCVIDTYDKLTKVFQCKETEFFCNIESTDRCAHDYFEQWNAIIQEKNVDIEVPFSNIYAAQKLSSIIPPNSYLNFAILNSLRVWSLFNIDSSIICYSNVAAFGIDGGLSTLIGESVETDELCFMIIGDLAFYYDMNSIAIRHIQNNVRILLVNNNGGIEFKLKNKDNVSNDRYVAAANHFKNAAGWSRTCGFKYMSAYSKEEFDSQVEIFCNQSDQPILFEIFISDSDEAVAYQNIIQYNQAKDGGLKTDLKSLKKRIFG